MGKALTPKQEKFCQCVASGMSLKDSYIESYNTDNLCDQGIRNEASKLARRDDITQRIRELKKPLQNLYENDLINESRQVKDILWEIIRDTGEKTENQLRAIDILNRMNQAYQADTSGENAEDTIDKLDTDKLLQLVSSA